MQTRRPVAVDIFAGAGGLSEGFLAAGINVAVAVEQGVDHNSGNLIC